MFEEAPTVSGFGIAFLISMILLMAALPRRYAILPLLITTCYMPLGQKFMIFGLNIQFFRVLLLASWVRVLFCAEYRMARWGTIDRLFAWWVAVSLVIGCFTPPTSFEERLIRCSGEAFNAVASYFLIRCWIRSLDDVARVTRCLAFAIIPLAASMLVEKMTSHNIFSFLGGVPEITYERDGALRCQGAFRHPILAGVYGATLFPLFAGLWWRKRAFRKAAAIGAVCSFVVMFAAASSGALLAFLGSCASLGMWHYRSKLRIVRWMIVGGIAVLALVMNAPVWYIFSRLSEVFGGTGWYRSYLIEQAWKHFWEWCLLGSKFTAHWAPGGETPEGNPNNTDIVNQFVSEGLEGGILKLALFIAMIVVSFQILGRFIRRAKTVPLEQRKMAWAMGACLIAHCMSFMSVVYFDQIIVMWFWILASVAVLQMPRRSALPLPVGGKPSGEAKTTADFHWVNS